MREMFNDLTVVSSCLAPFESAEKRPTQAVENLSLKFTFKWRRNMKQLVKEAGSIF